MYSPTVSNPALATNTVSPSTHKSTLFLGDLSAFCSERDLHDAFSVFGEIADIKIMRSEDTTRNLSYGFLKFASPAAAKKALSAMNGMLFCGRKLRLGWACYKSKKEKHVQHHDRMDSSSVHVSYITHQIDRVVTEESLRVLFSTFGNVLDASIKKSFLDESMQRQCGYGFVHYSSAAEGMQSALSAVAALNDKIVENISFKCSLSHNLERQIIDQQRRHTSFLAQEEIPNTSFAPQRVHALSGSPLSVRSTAHTVNGPHGCNDFGVPTNSASNGVDYFRAHGSQHVTHMPPTQLSSRPSSLLQSSLVSAGRRIESVPKSFADYAEPRNFLASSYTSFAEPLRSSSLTSTSKLPTFDSFSSASPNNVFNFNIGNSHNGIDLPTFRDDLFQLPSKDNADAQFPSFMFQGLQPSNNTISVNFSPVLDDRDSLDSRSDSSLSPRDAVPLLHVTPFQLSNDINSCFSQWKGFA